MAYYNTVADKSKKSQNQKEFKLGDGSLASDMKLICNKFNEFFVNVEPSLSKKIATQNIVPTEFIKNKAVYSLYLEPVNESEIKKLISSLKSNTPGYDMIGSAALKWCADFLSEPLAHACNMSLQKGIFPDELKIANAILLYKCHDPKLFNNYRPVPVLPSVSKIFERMMYIIGLYLLSSLKKCQSMVSEEIHCRGLRVIWKTNDNCLPIMMYYLIPKFYNVEFLKVLFLDHFSFWFI